MGYLYAYNTNLSKLNIYIEFSIFVFSSGRVSEAEEWRRQWEGVAEAGRGGCGG
jgi:hypothetical protein